MSAQAAKMTELINQLQTHISEASFAMGGTMQEVRTLQRNGNPQEGIGAWLAGQQIAIMSCMAMFNDVVQVLVHLTDTVDALIELGGELYE